MDFSNSTIGTEPTWTPKQGENGIYYVDTSYGRVYYYVGPVVLDTLPRGIYEAVGRLFREEPQHERNESKEPRWPEQRQRLAAGRRGDRRAIRIVGSGVQRLSC